jgi:hypothetical protein
MRRVPSRVTVTKGISGAGADVDWRILSVGHVGSQTERTLFIACLRYPACVAGIAAAQKVDLPKRAANPCYRQNLRRQGCYAPARDGGGRFVNLILSKRGLPIKSKSRCTRRPRGKMQAASRDHAQRIHFADNGRKPSMPQAFFHDRQERFFIPGFGKDDAAGLQPYKGKAGGKKVARFKAPQNRPLGSRQNAGHKEGRGCFMADAGGCADFVQDAEFQAPLGQMSIQKRAAKGKGVVFRLVGTLKLLDLLT